MYRSFKFTLTLLALFSASACGLNTQKDQKDEQEQKRVLVGSFDSRVADPYFMEDPICIDKTGAGRIGTTGVNLWDGESVSLVDFQFSNVSSTDILSSKIIGRTYYDYHQQRKCEYKNSKLICDDKAKVIGHPKALKVCRREGPYSRFSVEGIALSTLSSVETAYQYYRTLGNKDYNMLKADLLVLPTIEQLIQNAPEALESPGLIRDDDGSVLQLSTDNLAYSPSFRGGPSFIIFPKGRTAQSKGLWEGVNLWEIPWAVAHEFGHHVFRTHTKIENIESLSAAATGFSDSNLLLATTLQSSLASKRAYDAVNEAFSDLFAFYVHGAEPGLLDNIDCFDTNRDVSRSKFINGKAKDLNDSHLKRFQGSYLKSSGGCTKPDFSDIHTVGAVVAYAVDRLFSLKVGGRSGSRPAQDKASLVVEWAEKLGPLAKKRAGKDLDLSTLIGPAVDLAKSDGKLSTPQCEVIRDHLSALQGELLASGECD